MIETRGRAAILLAIVLLGGPAPAPAAAPCTGRYVVTMSTGPLVAGPGDVLVLDAAGAVLDPACGATAMRARGHARAAGRWRDCRGKRVLRLKLRASGDCTLLRGVLSAPGARASRFVAVASRCGDGVADAGTGERCDDGNLLADDGCDERCGRCVDPATLASTWAAIQANVLDAACIVCHGDKQTAGLDLRAPGSYARIVGVPAAGGRSQVRPGDRQASLMWLKLAKATFGSDDDNLGGGMPFGYALPAGMVEAFGRWIDAGAPADGFVPGTEDLLPACGG